MAKHKAKPSGPRPFDPDVLSPYATPSIRPVIGAGAKVLRFTVLVPVDEVRPRERTIATPADVARLEEMFPLHFGGLTVQPKVFGYGARDSQTGEIQLNVNVPYVVYAAPNKYSKKYVRALQHELQDALNEGVILIERQVVELM